MSYDNEQFVSQPTADVGAEVAAVIQARMDRGTSGRWIADCGETPQTLADALAPLIAERVEAAKAEALGEAADRWEQAVERNTNALDLEVAERVVGWLRDRAAAIGSGAT